MFACFQIFGLPSRLFAPGARPGTPSPQDETDLEVLWKQDAQRVNALYGGALNSHRAAIGLPPVDNVRDYVFTEQPWLAADATLCPSQGMTDLDIVQTGAWILPDDRPLPEGPEAFLDAGDPPVYVGFGSIASYARKDIARVAELGIGAAHEDSTPTVDSLSAALTTALSTETRTRARTVAGTIRADGATVAAKLLLDPASPEGRP